MNKKQNSTESYFILTGNPFVDAGVYAIEAYYRKNFSDLTPKDKDFQNYKKKGGE